MTPKPPAAARPGDSRFPPDRRPRKRRCEDKQGINNMVVRAGREFLAIPGPTNMPDAVLQAMHRPALDIYSTPMVELTDSLLDDLARLFATEGRTYIHIANGHGAWESSLSNVLSRGDKI